MEFQLPKAMLKCKFSEDVPENLINNVQTKSSME